MLTISSILSDPEYPIKDKNTVSTNSDNVQQSMASVSIVTPPSREQSRDGLAVVQMESSKISEVRVPEGFTLDSSIKKPREGDSYSDPPSTQIHEINTLCPPQIIIIFKFKIKICINIILKTWF